MHKSNSRLFIGLMSGTSLDGIDAVVVSFPAQGNSQPKLLAAINKPFEPMLRRRILELCSPKASSLQDMCELDVELAEVFAQAVQDLLEDNGYRHDNIEAIGSHGQTVLHHTDSGTRRYSLQIGDPNTIAMRTGILSVADFRRMDIAAGGQGAPLVPAFHDAYLRDPNENRVVANIGGMANITVLASGRETTGFDTGPGNVLLDSWAQKHIGMPFDRNGEWARTGILQNDLLDTWLAHPYFSRSAPKSTGRETFNLNWLQSTLEKHADRKPEDIQRTLTELTAKTLADSIDGTGMAISKVLLCGGGSHNHFLRERLASMMAGVSVNDTGSEGIDPDWMEAIAFAWLAKQRIDHRRVNIRSVTGASLDCVLGGIYLPPGKSI